MVAHNSRKKSTVMRNRGGHRNNSRSNRGGRSRNNGNSNQQNWQQREPHQPQFDQGRGRDQAMGPSRPANPGPQHENYHLEDQRIPPWEPNQNWSSQHHDADINRYGFSSNVQREVMPGQRYPQVHDYEQEQPPRYDHHSQMELEKRQSILQQNPHGEDLDTRRPVSPRVFYQTSPHKESNPIPDSPVFLPGNNESPRYSDPNSNERWHPHPVDQPGRIVDIPPPPRPYDPNSEPVHFSIQRSNQEKTLAENPLDELNHPKSSSSRKSRRGGRDRSRSRDRDSRKREDHQKGDVVVDYEEPYEPEIIENEDEYVPAMSTDSNQFGQRQNQLCIPEEFQRVTGYMTQVLETMMERQRLEMNQKLNEMFKQYFQAKEAEYTENHSKEPDEDDELDRLREAAMKSAETKRTFSVDQTESQRFGSFAEFKKYKQTMREKGGREEMLVEIPNISDNAADIVDAELNLSNNAAENTQSEQIHTAERNQKEPYLQISIENTPTPATKPTPRKVGNPDDPINTNTTTEKQYSQMEKENNPKPAKGAPLPIKASLMTFRDPNRHYCAVTKTWVSSIGELLKHLHSDAYTKELPQSEKPWEKRLDVLQKQIKERDEMQEALRKTPPFAQGSEFFIPVKAFKCKLCEKIIRTEAEMTAHFLGDHHNEKYEQMKAKDSTYEQKRLKMVQEALKRQKDLIAAEKAKIIKRRSEQKRKLEESGSNNSSPTSANKKINSSQLQSPSSQIVQNTPSSLLPLAPAPLQLPAAISMVSPKRDKLPPKRNNTSPAGNNQRAETESHESSVKSLDTSNKSSPGSGRVKKRSAAIERILALSRKKRSREQSPSGEEPRPSSIPTSDQAPPSEPSKASDPPVTMDCETPDLPEPETLEQPSSMVVEPGSNQDGQTALGETTSLVDKQNTKNESPGLEPCPTADDNGVLPPNSESEPLKASILDIDAKSDSISQKEESEITDSIAGQDSCVAKEPIDEAMPPTESVGE